MSTLNLPAVARLAVPLSMALALCLVPASASSITDQGSTAVSRTNADTTGGQVYIYDGGFFANGETVTTFNWFGPVFGAGNKNLTPILLTETNGVFTVVAIGSTESFGSGAGAQSAGFGLQAGTDVVSGANWTFGFVEAAADSSGTLSSTTAGGVPFNSPIDGGQGTGGVGTTNDWVFTPSVGGLNVGLGTTFFIPGGNGTGNFTLNTAGLGGFNVNRTYSANADGSLSGVAEPGTFSLITGAGLVFAGLFRYRYTRGKKS